MFKNNKYTKTYFDLIEKCKSEKRLKMKTSNSDYIYYELHHIFPSCLSKEKSNLKENPENGVLLTGKEHYIAHLLLTKMCKDPVSSNKMKFALYNFARSSKEQKRNLKSYQYENIRKLHKKYLEKNYEERFGKEKSDNIKLKMSASRTGAKNGMYSKRHSDETIEKISKKAKARSAKQKGLTNVEIFGKQKAALISEKISIKTKDYHEKISGKTYEDIYGIDKANEIKEKLSKASKGKKLGPSKNKGKKWPAEFRETARISALKRVKKECQYCNRMLDPGNFKQFHGEKCKLKK
jgi:hypothetical protein